MTRHSSNIQGKNSQSIRARYGSSFKAETQSILEQTLTSHSKNVLRAIHWPSTCPNSTLNLPVTLTNIIFLSSYFTIALLTYFPTHTHNLVQQTHTHSTFSFRTTSTTSIVLHTNTQNHCVYVSDVQFARVCLTNNNEN